MAYIFLANDLAQIDAQIRSLAALLKSIGREMGVACQQGAETYHDNFGYEDGARQHRMWSERLRELLRIRAEARVVQPDENTGVVAVGRSVTVRDLETMEVTTFRVGSYMVMGDRDGALSYAAPRVRPLLGARVGEAREVELGGSTRELEILAVT